ncbi:MAG: glycoside hydrolase family 31 protein [Chitinophagales bacterium]
MRKLVLLSIGLFAFTLTWTSCKKDKTPDGNPIDTSGHDTTYIQTTPWPKWVFQHWVWEDEGTSVSARQLVDDYMAHGIPVDAIIIDSPWETEYNTFICDPNSYGDAKEMVDYFHSKNVKVLFWITGVIDTNVHPLYDYAASHDYFMKANASATTPAVFHWWKGNGSLIDLYNPDAVNWWKGMMDSTLALGIDGWKCDGSDYYALSATYSPGLAATVTRLDYSHHYYQLFHDYTRQKLGNDRIIMSRPIDNYNLGDFGGDFVAFTPKEIGWACWVGDQDATYDGMKAALNNMYWSSVYPYMAFGSDIGGYREDGSSLGRTKDVFIRWAQLGTFCPLMENGGGGEHRPWMFDQQTTDIYKGLAIMRDKYITGYLMEAAKKAYAENKSIITFFNKTDYSYMLGDDIFVTPMLDNGTDVTINFPAGSDWVYLYNKERIYTGGTSEYLSFPLEEFPVFIKKGTSTALVLRHTL